MSKPVLVSKTLHWTNGQFAKPGQNRNWFLYNKNALSNEIFYLASHIHLRFFFFYTLSWTVTFEPPYDKTNKMACVPSEDSDQPGHPLSLWSDSSLSPWRKLGSWAIQWAHSEDWSDWAANWADTQADRSLCWAHSHFVGFVIRRLISA